MLTFLVKRKPRSVNARTAKNYKNDIVAAFSEKYPNHIPLTTKLYTRIHYFHSEPATIDADNLSKPILDALRIVTYNDDNLVKFRSCSIIDISENNVNEFNVTKMPEELLKDFFNALDSTKHLVYIDIGEFSNLLITFGGV